jgi:hypothetical protein
MCHDFKNFVQHPEIFMKKVKNTLQRIDTDPDRPDHDPQHWGTGITPTPSNRPSDPSETAICFTKYTYFKKISPISEQRKQFFSVPSSWRTRH